ncbi:MAG TPA: phage holin family protein [Verrucomicrobiae bacterium]
MDDQEEVQPTLSETLRRVGASILAILQNRLELLVVELHESRLHLFEALFLVVAVVVLSLFTLGLASAAVIYLVWNQFGVIGLFVLSAVGLVATLLVGWRLYLHLKNWPLLPGTLEQLKKDRECLEIK